MNCKFQPRICSLLCYLKVHCVDLDKGKGFVKQAFWVQISDGVSGIHLYYDI